MGSTTEIGRASRGIMGMIGAGTSSGWRYLEENGQAYNRSLEERRLPPSLFVSERDRVRSGIVTPISERCIEEPGAGVRRSEWNIEELEVDR